MTKNKKIFFRLLGALTTGGALVANSCVAKEAKKVAKDYTTRGSKIDNGKWGRFFEDSNGNLWAMGWWRRLQVLTRNEDGSYASAWSVDPNHRLLKGSNIINGLDGYIFEDSSGNIWSMGEGTPLQVLVKKKDGTYAKTWHSDRASGLTKGSNIKNGGQGIIFEDTRGNIWTMATDAVLQVLAKKPDGTFVDSWSHSWQKGLTKHSSITFGGDGGKIIEDSSGNLWAAARNDRLQVLAKNASGNYVENWNDYTEDYSKSLTKGSVDTAGETWTIFEDTSDNIWAMTSEAPLQVLAKDTNGNFVEAWTNDKKHGLLKDSNISDGHFGAIFEDSKGNLWAMGRKSPLQVLTKKADGNYAASWNSPKAQQLLADSNIKDGFMGIIFEDKNGNIFSVGYKTPLQVLAKKPDGSFASSWTSDKSHPLLKGSNVPSSYKARIFVDSKGNIWAMIPNRPIQVW